MFGLMGTDISFPVCRLTTFRFASHHGVSSKVATWGSSWKAGSSSFSGTMNPPA